MRKSEREIKDKQELELVIQKGQVLHLGLSENDVPYVVPLCYGYNSKSIYFHCAHEGKKLDIIRKNNRISFEIDCDIELVKGDVPCKFSMKYRSVIGFGRAFFVERADEKKEALKTVVKHYSGAAYDFSDNEIKSVTVVRIEIESMTGKKSRY